MVSQGTRIEFVRANWNDSVEIEWDWIGFIDCKMMMKDKAF